MDKIEKLLREAADKDMVLATQKIGNVLNVFMHPRYIRGEERCLSRWWRTCLHVKEEAETEVLPVTCGGLDSFSDATREILGYLNVLSVNNTLSGSANEIKLNDLRAKIKRHMEGLIKTKKHRAVESGGVSDNIFDRIERLKQATLNATTVFIGKKECAEIRTLKKDNCFTSCCKPMSNSEYFGGTTIHNLEVVCVDRPSFLVVK